ncbi:MAG TPA: malectin domain-containing carbohydrate-binding protein [Polyangia bacterium]|nr:malectin domain-containing carbohydrate-binding protein [Polyangia bacterium]
MRSLTTKFWALAGLAVFVGAGCGQVPGGDGADDVSMVESAVTSGAAKINCGAAAVSPFAADVDFSGGSTVTRTNTIDVSAVYNPAPASVYQSQRYGNFTYTLPGFTAGAWNQVRLHFADTHWTSAGSRSFNVSINGTAVLSNFDIIATVGAGNKALVEQFTLPANSSGQYVIQFTTVTDAATVSGIEVGPVPALGAGTPTTATGTAYATQCAQQLVPLPPSFGGGGTCGSCFPTTSSCIGCSAGSWTYAGQVSSANSQSFNGTESVDIFYWEAPPGATPGMCMMAARDKMDISQYPATPTTGVDFLGVICQSATGATCFWDEALPSQFSWKTTGGAAGMQGHVVVPTSAKVIASKTSLPSPAPFVGGADLVAGSSKHTYQNACADCHSGRNAFNNHPGTATDIHNRNLVATANDWFPAAWPAPIVPAWDPRQGALGAPWPRNPGPQAEVGNDQCFGCHNNTTGLGSGGLFPSVSLVTQTWCQQVFREAAFRTNPDCSADTDFTCPSGAMPPYVVSTQNALNDPFVALMSAPATGNCNEDFRTQLATPPGGGTVLNAPYAMTNMASSPFNEAMTFAVSTAGKVITYDPVQMKWITTSGINKDSSGKTIVPPGTVSQVSVGFDGSVWALSSSGGLQYVCGATPTCPAEDFCNPPCDSSGKCDWICDQTGYGGTYKQIAVTGGGPVWAVDGGGYVLYESVVDHHSPYRPDSLFAANSWPVGDGIAQLSVTLDGNRLWVLSTQGHISKQNNPFTGDGSSFTTIAPPSGGKVVSIAAANELDIWVASSTGVYKLLSNNTWERHCPTTGCGTSFTAVSGGGQSGYNNAEIWALDTAGNAYRVDRLMGSTTNSLVKVPGATLSHIWVGGQGDVMGATSAGTVYSFQ